MQGNLLLLASRYQFSGCGNPPSIQKKVNMAKMESFDVIIIGGSYAGLAAAMSLGRALRDVLVVDGGNPCNKQTPHSHNFLTRDGESPAKLSEKARKEVLKYPSVTLKEGRVTAITQPEDYFNVQTEANGIYSARKIIFATGVLDIMPDIAGFAECWGRSILHCPYCHGYEFQEQKTGILGNGQAGFDQSKFISNWTSDLVLYTNGKSTLTKEQTELLDKNGIEIREEEIRAFEHKNGKIQNIVFNDGSKQDLDVLYASPDIKQQSELPGELGCDFTEHGRIEVDIFQKTNVPGIYAAGDNSSLGRAVSVAVAAGSVAGMMLNKELVEEEFNSEEKVPV